MTHDIIRSNKQGPKYDLRVNPIYQVDWQNEASGKRVGATKRRIRWRFGFSNRQALNEGLTGVDCRGEEHEVVLVWSLTSGKRLVLVDGQQVHFSAGRRCTETKFETSWSMFGGHIFKVIAHAAAPLFNNEQAFRQFDLELDGMSFHSFPKIFELGKGRHNNRYSRDVESSAYGQDQYRFATPASVGASTPTNRTLAPPQPVAVTPEVPKKQVSPAPVVVAAPAPAFEDLLSGPSSPQSENDLLWNSVPQLTHTPQQPAIQHQAYYQQQQQYSQQQLVAYNSDPVQDEFAPVPPPPRSFQDVSKDILSHYTLDPSVPALTYTAHYSEQSYQSSSLGASKEDESSLSAHKVTPDKSQKTTAVTLKPTMQPISIVEMEERDQPLVSPMEKAVKSLVNLDDITAMLETPEQARAARSKQQKQTKSKPLPPTNPQWHLGLRPALGGIQNCPTAKAAPKKEIMRTHAFDPAAAQAGMVVVYGSSIPGASGFGAGMYHQSSHHHYGAGAYYPQQHRYQQQQQPQRLYAAV